MSKIVSLFFLARNLKDRFVCVYAYCPERILWRGYSTGVKAENINFHQYTIPKDKTAIFMSVICSEENYSSFFTYLNILGTNTISCLLLRGNRWENKYLMIVSIDKNWCSFLLCVYPSVIYFVFSLVSSPTVTLVSVHCIGKSIRK